MFPVGVSGRLCCFQLVLVGGSVLVIVLFPVGVSGRLCFVLVVLLFPVGVSGRLCCVAGSHVVSSWC